MSKDSFPEIESRFLRIQASKHCTIPREVLRYEYSYMEFREVEDEITYWENMEYIEGQLVKQKEELEKSRMNRGMPSGWGN